MLIDIFLSSYLIFQGKIMNMHCTLSIQSYAYYLQLGMLIKWQTLREHFYCPIQHMFYCYFIWFYQIEFNCNYKLKIKIWHNHCAMKVSMAKNKTRQGDKDGMWHNPFRELSFQIQEVLDYRDLNWCNYNPHDTGIN